MPRPPDEHDILGALLLALLRERDRTLRRVLARTFVNLRVLVRRRRGSAA